MSENKDMWKDIEGYERYYKVSDTGKIRSLERYVPSKNQSITFDLFIKGRILKLYTNKNGYVYINLRRDSKTKHARLHRLVAKAFIPNPQNKLEVNHINGIKTDNRIENLEWCTHEENTLHAIKTGLRN